MGTGAKGTATEESHIALCFFSRQLFRLTRKYKGIDIEPRGFPISEPGNGNPFVKEALRTGVEL